MLRNTPCLAVGMAVACAPPTNVELDFGDRFAGDAISLACEASVEPPEAWQHDTDLHLVSQDSLTTVDYLQRCEMVCAGSCPCEALRMAINHNGAHECINAMSDLTHNNTHHNWGDTIEAFAPSGRFLLAWTTSWDPPMRNYQVTAFNRDDGSTLWGPVVLTE